MAKQMMQKSVVVVHEPPPIYEELVREFNIDWESGVIIAWNGKVYTKDTLDPQKVIHELVHLDEQKKMGNEAWWQLYIENQQFRLDQEVMAMKAEIRFLRKYIKDREAVFRMIREIVLSLSSPMYGNIIDQKGAYRLLM